MSYVKCPKCEGKNSKNFETCSCVKGEFADKGCPVCKGSGKCPCYTCDGKGGVDVGDRP